MIADSTLPTTHNSRQMYPQPLCGYPNGAMIVSYSVHSRHPLRIRLLTIGLFAVAVPVAAHAFERVTLRNGFSYDCARRELLDDRHIRLFLATSGRSADAPTNFIDLPLQSIAAVEVLPDPVEVVPNEPAALPVPMVAAPDMHALLSSAGATHNIDFELLASVIHTESGGYARAVSRTGARGLMQLMPGTAQQLGVTDAFQPSQNIAGGTMYLDELLTRYHDNLALALAAYNAGPAAVDRYHGIPPYRETRAYVARVITEFKHRKLALAHAQAQAATQLASR